MTTATTTSTLHENVRSNREEREKIECKNGHLENNFSKAIPGQKIAVFPSFTLESGFKMQNVPVAYMTWGNLSPDGNNAMVVCHALSGSANLSDWWGPLLGPGRAFDTERFFIICLNSLGSPYGTASPVTAKNGNPAEGYYGANFPLTTIRDDVRLHRLVLDSLGVRQVAAVIGGSMGGMLALEWAYHGKDYVRCIVPVATCSHQSAWGICWGEAQRQAIYSDDKYNGGRYSLDDPPTAGLGAARMAALLTYRSKDSLDKRFGRQASTDKVPMTKITEEIGQVNHLGHNGNNHQVQLPNSSPTKTSLTSFESTHTNFAAQSYLRHQSKKFSCRFDSNCYIALTRKLDTHDLSRNRADTVTQALSMIEQPSLVLGVRSDGLYAISEQEQIARCVPNARLREIVSHDGHDAFLIESGQINGLVIDFLHEVLSDIMMK